MQEYGIDWDGPIPLDDEDDAVIVSETACPCPDDDFASLAALCSLERVLNSDCHGVDVYQQALEFIRARHSSQWCN